LEFKIITGMKSCQAHLGFIDYVLTQPRRGDIIVDNRFYYTRNPEGGDIIKRKANNVTLYAPSRIRGRGASYKPSAVSTSLTFKLLSYATRSIVD
jgi:hypothetical protein